MACKIITSRILTEEERSYLKDFIGFCKEKLEIQELPVLIKIFESKNDGMTTGGYSPQTKEVFCLGGKRMLLDVFRTIAHELTHHKQNERGNLHELLEEYPEDLYSPYENEAYEMSGNIIKEWTRIQKKKNEQHKLYELYY